MSTLELRLGRPGMPQLAADVHDRISAVLRYGLLTMAVLYILMYIVLACLRMGYPYELEWMEGGIVDHVRWILAGRPLYVAPSLEFTPNIYAPLYFYLGAAASKVLGVGLFPLRLISFAASLGSLWLILAFVRRETGSGTWGVVSAGLFAATYRFTGAWMDIARVDSLFLLLALAAVYVLRFGTGPWSLIGAGLLMGLSFQTKQAALFIALPLIVYTLLACKGWVRYAFAATFVGFVAVTIGLLDAVTDGWYSYYTFNLPRQHAIVTNMAFGFWWLDIGRNLAVTLTMTILAMALVAATRPRRELGFYLMLLLGMLEASWFSRLHTGGYDNVLLPAAAVLAISFSLGATALQAAVQTAAAGGAAQAGDAPAIRRALLSALYLVGIWQFLVLGYWPDQQLPHSRDRRGGDAMIQTLARLDGDVFLPEHGYLHTLAGRRTFHAHASALWDILQGTDKQLIAALQCDIRQAIQARRFDVLVLDVTPVNMTEFLRRIAANIGIDEEVDGSSLLDLFRPEVEANYQYVGPVFQKGNVFWPVTGNLTRPGRVYVRKDKIDPFDLAAWQPTSARPKRANADSAGTNTPW